MLLSASWPSLLMLCVAAFLVGSIPFGLVVGRVVKGVDIRQLGSGNIGAANVFRTLGPALGVVVMLLDALKGYLPVRLTHTMFAMLGASCPSAATAAVGVGLAAIIGHNNSIYLGFKGGKGIATMFGVLLAISPPATGVAAICWALTMALSRYASLSSLVAATSIPLYFMLTQAEAPYVIFGMLACVLAFVRHRPNIRNLMSGREPRMGVRGGASDGQKPR